MAGSLSRPVRIACIALACCADLKAVLEPPPCPSHLLRHATQLAVVHVKPFGAFLEFQAELPSFLGAPGGSERAPLVGLVHRSEVSWDPDVTITDALQVRCGQGGWLEKVRVMGPVDRNKVSWDRMSPLRRAAGALGWAGQSRVGRSVWLAGRHSVACSRVPPQ